MVDVVRGAGLTVPDDLPWVKPFRRRCRSTLHKVDSPIYHGRCELRRGHDGPHALERGMFALVWTVDVR